MHAAALLAAASALSQLLVVGVDRSVESFRLQPIRATLQEANAKIGDVTVFHLVIIVLVFALAVGSFGVVVYAAAHDRNVLYMVSLIITVLLAGTTCVLNAIFTAADSRFFKEQIISNENHIFKDVDESLTRATPILPSSFFYIFSAVNLLIGGLALTHLAMNRRELERQRPEDEVQVLSTEEQEEHVEEEIPAV